MFRKKVTLTILLCLIFSDVLETLTNFFFKKSVLAYASLQITGLSDGFIFFKDVFSSPFLWAGFLSVIAVFIIWSSVLSRIDLSVAVPIASFSYVLVPLVSAVLLHEKITLLRWLGIFFILIGVIFVSLSSKEKVGEQE